MGVVGWLRFLLAAITLAVVVGCGSGERRSSEAPAQDPSTSVSSTDTNGSGETADAAQTDAEDASVPAVEEMSVFLRPRTEADVLPRGLGLPYEMPCEEWHRAHGGCGGDAIGGESRLLLSGLGVRNVSLYAWPTTNGWVCWARVGEGGGGCLADFREAQTRVAYGGIDPDQECMGYPGTLLGVVPDDVVSADVQVRGVRHPAIVESNAVFYELTDASFPMRAFDSLTATFSDGSTATDPIGWRTSRSDETCAG